jgi:hypothetical protein
MPRGDDAPGAAGAQPPTLRPRAKHRPTTTPAEGALGLGGALLSALTYAGLP